MPKGTGIVQYNWTRHIVDVHGEPHDIEMSLPLEIAVEYTPGRYTGPYEDSYPDEYDIDLKDGYQGMTDQEIEDAIEWLYNQDLNDIVYSSYHDAMEDKLQAYRDELSEIGV